MRQSWDCWKGRTDLSQVFAPFRSMLPPEESIREVVKDCMNAWNKHDAKALASLYAKDGEFTSWMGQGTTGQDAIEKYHERLFATRFKNTHQTTENIKVRLIKPDVASVDIWWNMTGALDGSGQPDLRDEAFLAGS